MELEVEEGVEASGRALADIKLALIAILLIQEEEGHTACVAFLERIPHQELRLADELLLLWLLGVYLDNLEHEGLHGHWDPRACLTAHKFEAREVEALNGRVVNRFLLMAQKWGNFSHDQFIYLQIEVLLAKLLALVIEFGRRLKSNLLQLVLFSFLSFHSNFKNLTVIHAERRIGHRAKQKFRKIR